MVGGFDRYFQIARCLRDEDLRADRQFEFMQLDMECSFASQDDVMAYVSEAVLDAAEAATGERPPPIERMTSAESRDRYGTDKPDLRFGLELIDLSEAFADTEVKAFSSPTVKAIVVPDGATWPRKRLDEVTELAKKHGAAGLAWFRVVENGPSLDGPLARHLSEAEAGSVLQQTKAAPGDLILAVSDIYVTACAVLGALRLAMRRRPWARARIDTSGSSTSPCSTAPGPTAIRSRRTIRSRCPTPRTCRCWRPTRSPCARRPTTSCSTDGSSGSGSVRIHRRDIQEQVFAALGISAEEAEARFGFLLGAFRYGAPPHAGFAVGVDRLVAILAGEENIREVIAYPKTQSGADLLTGAPTALPPPAWPSWGSGSWCRRAPHRAPPPERRTAALSLFADAADRRLQRQAPLAARLRPRTLDEVVGQEHLIGPGAPLRLLAESDRVGSSILWGPAGTGKTTLARLLADTTAKHLVTLSATAAGVKDVREALAEAQRRLGEQGQGTMLFIDEVHRFSKSQQDVLLPAVEDGLVVLIGATTENPFFEVNPPLLSRTSLWRLHALSPDNLRTLIRRGLELEGADAEDDAVDAVVAACEGDARAALTTVETAVALARGTGARRRPGGADDGRHGPGPRRPSLPSGRRRALRPDQCVDQERAGLGPRRRPLLDGPHDRGGRGPPLPGPPHGDPGQ